MHLKAKDYKKAIKKDHLDFLHVPSSEGCQWCVDSMHLHSSKSLSKSV